MANKVIVYMTQTCPYCHMAVDYLRKNKVNFVSYDVGVDERRAQEMIEKSGQMGVPVIDVDGKIIVGFDKPAIAKALGLKE
ncbi:MAG: glutaredoxin family protein [Candidatus Micrarchaeia archaeon]